LVAGCTKTIPPSVRSNVADGMHSAGPDYTQEAGDELLAALDAFFWVRSL